jgi:hypothetical protein
MIVSRSVLYQQTLGAALVEMGGRRRRGHDVSLAGADRDAWPYDARCRVVGEDVWEYATSEREFIKLETAEVLTQERAGELLEELIKPLPSFDDSLLAAA